MPIGAAKNWTATFQGEAEHFCLGRRKIAIVSLWCRRRAAELVNPVKAMGRIVEKAVCLCTCSVASSEGATTPSTTQLPCGDPAVTPTRPE